MMLRMEQVPGFVPATTRNKVYYGNAMKMLRLEPEVAKVPKAVAKKKAAKK